MCRDSLGKRKKQPWGALPASGERSWGVERNGTESVNYWRPEPECIEDGGSNVNWQQIVVSAGFEILPKVENWMKLFCPPQNYRLRAHPKGHVNTGTLLPPSPLVAWASKSQPWFGLIWDGKKTRTGGGVNEGDLLLGSGETRRGLKSCSSLTLIKLIFTLFLKINEIICAVVFSHQSRYKLLLLIG